MTDLEITKLCAEAIGYKVQASENDNVWVAYRWNTPRTDWMEYLPLHDDAQAMALVKKFPTQAKEAFDNWIACIEDDLNRAICECVAKMQASQPHGTRTGRISGEHNVQT